MQHSALFTTAWRSSDVQTRTLRTDKSLTWHRHSSLSSLVACLCVHRLTKHLPMSPSVARPLTHTSIPRTCIYTSVALQHVHMLAFKHGCTTAQCRLQSCFACHRHPSHPPYCLPQAPDRPSHSPTPSWTCLSPTTHSHTYPRHPLPHFVITTGHRDTAEAVGHHI